jgi:hypothetical protein
MSGYQSTRPRFNRAVIMTGMRLTSILPVILLISVLTGCGVTVTRTIVVTATPGPATIAPPTVPPTSPPTAGPVSSSPSSIALTLNDVGGAFIETASTSHSNAEVAATYHLSPADLARRGRITSYETQFSEQQASGILQVDDVVAAWRTPKGAQWDFTRVVSQILNSRPRPQGVQTLSVPGLGDSRRAFTFHAARQPANLVDYALIFRRGRYRAYIQVVGITGTVDDSAVLRLAHIVDSRMQRATA